MIDLQDSLEQNLINSIFRDVKRMYESTVKPLETIYKYRQITTRLITYVLFPITLPSVFMHKFVATRKYSPSQWYYSLGANPLASRLWSTIYWESMTHLGRSKSVIVPGSSFCIINYWPRCCITNQIYHTVVWRELHSSQSNWTGCWLYFLKLTTFWWTILDWLHWCTSVADQHSSKGKLSFLFLVQVN